MNNKLTDTEVILVELDAILDTRIPIYKKLGGNIDTIFSLGYRNRVYDRHPGVDYDDYMKAYINRDKTLLATASITEVPYHIAEELRDVAAFRSPSGLPDLVEVWVNVYPYQLEDEEKFNIGQAFSEIFVKTGARIKVKSIPHKDIDKDFIKDNGISTLYLYQYEEWLQVHAEKFAMDKDLPMDLTVVTPWLISAEMTEDLTNELADLIDSNIQPIALLRAQYAGWFDLDLVKSKMFSTILADDILPDYVS